MVLGQNVADNLVDTGVLHMLVVVSTSHISSSSGFGKSRSYSTEHLAIRIRGPLKIWFKPCSSTALASFLFADEEQRYCVWKRKWTTNSTLHLFRTFMADITASCKDDLSIRLMSMMQLCGVLKYCSVFVTDERRSRLLKLGFGTMLPNPAPLDVNATAPSSSCKPDSKAPDVVLTDEEVGIRFADDSIDMVAFRRFTWLHLVSW